MPGILFWNIAGAGAVAGEDDLPGSLSKLAADHNPDCVVICEMRKLSSYDKRTSMRFNNYSYLKPVRYQPAGGPVSYYKDDDAKRLYVYTRNAGVSARMISTGQTRPALVISLNGVHIMVVHAPSVSSTSKPQAQTFKNGHDMAGDAHIPISAIFGDLNVDAQSPARIRSLQSHLSGHTIQAWQHLKTGELTHKGTSELDWALTHPSFNPTITAINPAAAKPRPLHTLRDSDEWAGDDSAVNKHSDHMAVMLSW